ncbi:MAG: hypothetical protein LRY66_00415, partial [Saccharospirillaceae bacterium]|nr:hypothetical protein [Saccharospirillaceae bacterium]
MESTSVGTTSVGTISVGTTSVGTISVGTTSVGTTFSRDIGFALKRPFKEFFRGHGPLLQIHSLLSRARPDPTDTFIV